ncbi:MAG: Ig-like domain-containing protein [Prevotella sp.]|nr:Ig-like domain-containing protein [Prevotella sp.]
MKRIMIITTFAFCFCMNAVSQATSLTVDCQTPGRLSSMVSYNDQQTVENIKVTGYMNASDISFLYRLNERSLTGVIDLEDVSIVKGGALSHYPGTVQTNNELPFNFFSNQAKHIRKFVYPKTLIHDPLLSFTKKEMVDSLIWTSTIDKEINIQNGIGEGKYIYIPEGIDTIRQIPRNTKIVFPNSIKVIWNSSNCNLIIYSSILEPRLVNAKYELYLSSTGRQYYASVYNSKIFIPKGTKEKYLSSDFATLSPYPSIETTPRSDLPSGNEFVEYYDVEGVEINAPPYMFVGDTIPFETKIYPNDSLVSWVDYDLSRNDIVDIDKGGRLIAKEFGQVEISATPHVFIDGLETKTGRCTVNVVAHTEAVEIPSELTVHIGEEKELNAHTLPIGKSNNQLKYVSSDSTIAVVTDNGVVKGLKRGVCSVTAISVDRGFSAECVINVIQQVESLSLEMHNVTLKVGETERLYARLEPYFAENKSVNWHSSNDSIISVDVNGNITANKGGNAWIKAVSEDNVMAKDSCKVVVTQPVSGIVLNHNKYQFKEIGDNITLEAFVQPDDATNKNVKWKSTDETVCIVSNGQVVAVGYGKSVIIAITEDGGFMATCTVNVTSDTDTSISSVEMHEHRDYQIFDTAGAKHKDLIKGVNIIRFADGTLKKVLVK